VRDGGGCGGGKTGRREKEEREARDRGKIEGHKNREGDKEGRSREMGERKRGGG